MSFISAATAMGLTGIGATIGAGVMMGGATTIGMNLIRGNDPFDNIGQGLLLGGISGGIFGGAGAAAGNAANATAATELAAIEAAAGPSTMVANTGNIASDVALNSPYAPAGTLSSAQTYGLADPSAGLQVNSLPPQTFVPDNVSDMAASDAARKSLDVPYGDPDAFANTFRAPVNNGLNAAQGNYEGGYFPTTSEQIARANNYEVMSPDAFKPINAPAPQTGSPLNKPASPASPEFLKDPFGYLTHKDNRGKAMLGGLGLAGAMGAFNPKTGLNNLPPRTVSDYETTYNPGTVNPNFGKPGEPYFLKQGYGPGTRVTRNVAAGGGIRALREGGETAPYVPMTARGQMTNKEDVPTDLDDSAAFKRYLKSDINKKEEKGQAAIDANISSWLERHAKSDIKGMAEGGLSNLPAAYQQPQYQMSDFANSPMFQPTGGNAPVQPGISEYIANINKYTPPARVAATTPAATTPAVTNTATPAPIYDQGPLGRMIRRAGLIKEDVPVATNTTSPTTSPTNTTSPVIYDPATQRYSTNPNLAVPSVVGNDSNPSDGGFSNNQEKAGGPIKSQKYAMGGLAALPEYAAGGKLLSGDGDGMSDSIPAVIKGARPQRAALADGEFVIPADVVSHLGNGSTKAGGKRLYEMMANIRKARTGNSKQGKQINPMKFIPA